MIKKYNKEIGFIYKNENNIDKIYKNNQLVFEQGFDREDSGSTPLTTSHEAIGKDLKGYKIYGNSRQNNLPDGYQEVEWIKSNKDINLGIKTNNNIQIEAKFLRTTTSAQFVYHSDSGSSLSTNTTAYASGNGVWRFGNKATAIPQNVNVIFETIQNKDGVWFNGEKAGSYTSVPTFTSSANLCALGSASNPSNQLYYLKLKEYGSSTYDYIWIPCKRTSDNSYGLYDIVGNEFYTNSEATITVGDDVVPTPSKPIEIESVGDLVTDTSDTNYGKYKIPVSDGTNTTNIYLDEPLRKIGDYADYIDFENGKIVRNIGKYTFVGTENWTVSTHTTSGDVRAYTTKLKKEADWEKPILCNIYTYQGLSISYPDINKCSLNSNVAFLIGIDGTQFETEQDYKDWVVSNNYDVYFVLVTPTEESITLPTIPSIKGTTIYSVGTKVQPSNMYIKYKGK